MGIHRVGWKMALNLEISHRILCLSHLPPPHQEWWRLRGAGHIATKHGVFPLILLSKCCAYIAWLMPLILLIFYKVFRVNPCDTQRSNELEYAQLFSWCIWMRLVRNFTKLKLILFLGRTYQRRNPRRFMWRLTCYTDAVDEIRLKAIFWCFMVYV